MRVMALDIGQQTIGVALTDPGGTLPRPALTLRRVGRRTDLDAIERLVREHGVERLVVGVPVRESGVHGAAAEAVERLARSLKNRLGMEIIGVDERYSTLEARELARQAGGGRRRPGHVDEHGWAAALILRRFLEEGAAVVCRTW